MWKELEASGFRLRGSAVRFADSPEDSERWAALRVAATDFSRCLTYVVNARICTECGKEVSHRTCRGK